ncbi:MAG: carbon-nitrogen family hydrolase [Coprothermobacterota bacterium]|nr:carbon-nitrogen family hydrolase [Coprothermobacterota bacterium]
MMKDTLRISLIQMDVTVGDWVVNCNTARKCLEGCANLKADLAMLPEMWSTGFIWHENFLELAGRTYRRTLTLLSQWAQRYRLYILAGSIPEVCDSKLFNTSFLFDPSGHILGSYRKRHLFHIIGEDRFFQPGQSEPIPIETPWGNLGVLICFDLRHPQEFQHLRQAGVRIILLPAQFPAPREHHWLTLLQARAIESQCFVCGCNRVGEDPPPQPFSYFGSSCVVSPTGEILLQGRSRETLVSTDLDLSLVEKTRRELPFYRE